MTVSPAPFESTASRRRGRLWRSIAHVFISEALGRGQHAPDVRTFARWLQSSCACPMSASDGGRARCSPVVTVVVKQVPGQSVVLAMVALVSGSLLPGGAAAGLATLDVGRSAVH